MVRWSFRAAKLFAFVHSAHGYLVGLFPDPMFHLGGDEIIETPYPKGGAWLGCGVCVCSAGFSCTSAHALRDSIITHYNNILIAFP